MAVSMTATVSLSASWYMTPCRPRFVGDQILASAALSLQRIAPASTLNPAPSCKSTADALFNSDDVANEGPKSCESGIPGPGTILASGSIIWSRLRLLRGMFL